MTDREGGSWGGDGQQAVDNYGKMRARAQPLTVDEALQYSPFSSIVPFSPVVEAIPFPSVRSSGTSPLFAQDDERQAARKDLLGLNQKAQAHPGSPQVLDEAVAEIQALFQATSLTKFNFKALVGQKVTDESSEGRPASHDHRLGDFSKMVLESTNVQPAYPSRTSPFSPKTKLPPKPRNSTTNDQSYAKNFETVSISMPAPTRQVPVVVVPEAPLSFRPEDYQSILPNGTSSNTSPARKRKVSPPTTIDPSVITIDRRQGSGNSTSALRELLRSMFELEDHLEQDTSGAVSATTSDIFEPCDFTEGEGQVLTASAHAKIDQAVTKVINDGKLSDMSLEDLLRLQRLCEKVIKPAGSVNVKLVSDCDEDDIEQWQKRADFADLALRSSRTWLRIMTGNRPENELYPEELVKDIIAVPRNILEDALVPAAQGGSPHATSAGAHLSNFKPTTDQKKLLATLLNQSKRVLRLISSLVAVKGIPESSVAVVEYMAYNLIFADNSNTEKDSILGVQKFEYLRASMMEVLTNVFSRYSEQRNSIVNEIVTSMGTLPTGRQNARQYKLAEGQSIQLVSALIMRLVQSSAVSSIDPKDRKKRQTLKLSDQLQDDEDVDGDSADEGQRALKENNVDSQETESDALRHPDKTFGKLIETALPLRDFAQHVAFSFTKTLVDRALTSTKSGDVPYRNLLDIFTEDFITVLSSPDWPAAELLLRGLLIRMIDIFEEGHAKSTAPAKNMALDLMGVMGSAISDLRLHARHSSKSLETHESELCHKLSELAEEALEDQNGKRRPQDGKRQALELTAWAGPYRAILTNLHERITGINDQLESAIAYHAVQWAIKLKDMIESVNPEDTDASSPGEESTKAAYHLEKIMTTPRWLEHFDKFETVSSTESRLAHTIVTLTLPFCQGFPRVVNILLTAMNSDQATVRSKGLKSVIQLLEKDPTILDTNSLVIPAILQRATDSSPLVRDSALGLIAKCLSLRPSLENEVYEFILPRATDAAIGVRKRAMKLLRDIYLRNSANDIRTSIADTLLHRVKDLDEGVAELARQTFEEIWISPFYRRTSDTSEETVEFKLNLKKQVHLIVKTVERAESVAPVLDALLQTILSNVSKNAAANFRVCASMVKKIFEEVVDGESTSTGADRRSLLETLTIFAKANPKLFNPEQLRHLQPYIENLSQSDDLAIYRSVIIIFRCVLPHFPALQASFLHEVQSSLLKALSRLNKGEMTEVIGCLWTINGVLNNTERLSRSTISCLQAISQARSTNFSDPAQAPALARTNRFLCLASLFGKHCTFQGNQLTLFRNAFPFWKGDSVPSLMIDIFSPLTISKQPLSIRKASIEGLGFICQSWPKQFLREQVSQAFENVFTERHRGLENLVLSGFKDFLSAEEGRSEKEADAADDDIGGPDSGRLAGAVAANQNDGVTTSIAQRYLSHIVRIALATQDGYALNAVEVIASINRQGLVHPKECAPVLVALETSQNTAIANIAFNEHRTLHEKHETIVEKEYMKAIQQAFVYQRDVVGDPLGAWTKPFSSKLHRFFDVLKISKGKIRKKCLANLCNRVDFDIARLDVTGTPPAHLQFSRFVAENLAFFDYSTVDDIMHVVACLERLVTATGPAIAHAIEVEVMHMRITNVDGAFNEASHVEDQLSSSLPEVDGIRLRQLTTASLILSALWDVRTYLQRLYGLQPGVVIKETKGKTAAKDANKAPVKTPGMPPDELWNLMRENMMALDSTKKMRRQCSEFLELLTVDKDIKVAAEIDDATNGAQYDTPSDDEGSMPATPGGTTGGAMKGRKRKPSNLTPGSRVKKRAKPAGAKASKHPALSDEDIFG